MLGRALRGRQAQWRLRQVISKRALFSVTGNKCSPQSSTSLLCYQFSVALNQARHVFGGSIRAYSGEAAAAGAAEVKQFDDTSLVDEHFIEHDLPYPLFAPDADADVEVIWSKASGEDGKQIVQAVEEWTQGGNVMTRELANRLLIRMLSRQQTQQNLKAWLFMHWVMHKEPYEITDQDRMTFLYLSSILARFGKCNIVFNKLSEKTPPAYEMLLRAHASSNRKCRSEFLIKRMEEEKLITSAGPYNDMISLYLRLSKGEQAKKCFDDLQAYGVAPDAHTYQMLLEHQTLLQPEDVADVKEKATAFLETVGEVRLKGQEWRNTIGLYADMGKAADVRRMWEDMCRSSKYVPDIYYYAAAEAYNIVENSSKFEQLCKEVATRGQEITAEQCHFMIRAYSRGRQMNKAELVLETAKENGLKMAFSAYNSLISGYMAGPRNKKDAVAAARTFRAYLEQHPKEGIQRPMVTAVPFLMDAYGLTGNVKDAEALVKMLRPSKKYPINVELFNSLLKVYTRHGAGVYDIDERVATFKDSPNDETHRLLERVYRLATAKVPEGAPTAPVV